MKNIYLIPILFLLTSCAFKRDHITIGYAPDYCPVKIVPVENVPVTVNVTDVRQNKNAVGCKKNGGGMECAYIVTDNDVAEVLKNAIEIELQARGFAISEGGAAIGIEFCKFNNDFKMGFFSGDACSEAIVHVLVKDRGEIKFSKTIFGYGWEEPCFLASGKNAALSLEEALKDTVQKIVNDPAFIDSLLKHN